MTDLNKTIHNKYMTSKVITLFYESLLENQSFKDLLVTHKQHSDATGQTNIFKFIDKKSGEVQTNAICEALVHALKQLDYPREAILEAKQLLQQLCSPGADNLAAA